MFSFSPQIPLHQNTLLTSIGTVIQHINACITKLSIHWICAIFLLAALIPALIITSVLHTIFIHTPCMDVLIVTTLTTMFVSAPIIILIANTYRMLDRSNTTLRKRTIDAERARRSAEEANRTKSVFLANMSHELRTPLNAIIGFSDMIRHRQALNLPEDTEKTSEYATSINSAGMHLLALVNDLLDLSRIDCGRFDITPEDQDIRTVLDNVVSQLKVTAKQRNQSIDVRIKCAAPSFYADTRASHQVLINLISNALKFSDEGTRVRVIVSDDGRNTIFDICDHGPGISGEDAKKALLPFERMSSAHIASGESTGLGLSISNSLCLMHEGSLSLQRNDDGIGTRARAVFPKQRITTRSNTEPSIYKIAS